MREILAESMIRDRLIFYELSVRGREILYDVAVEDEMRLRGTRTEFLIREMLVASNLSIREDKKIMKFLRESYGEFDSIYVLACTPEQGGLYEVLIDGGFVVGFEISRISDEISDVEEVSAADYLKKLRGRSSMLEMLIALDLANNH